MTSTHYSGCAALAGGKCTCAEMSELQKGIELPAQPIGAGHRVYHRRRDLFASVYAVFPDGTASVKYEWPWSADAPCEVVKVDELVHASEVEHGR